MKFRLVEKQAKSNNIEAQISTYTFLGGLLLIYDKTYHIPQNPIPETLTETLNP